MSAIGARFVNNVMPASVDALLNTGSSKKSINDATSTSFVNVVLKFLPYFVFRNLLDVIKHKIPFLFRMLIPNPKK